MNWSRFPFLRIAIAFGTGIFMFEYIDLPIQWVVYPLLIAIGLFLLMETFLKYRINRTFLSGLLLMVMVFLLGGVVIHLKKSKHEKTVLLTDKNENILIYGKISQKLKSETRPKFVLKTFWLKTSQNKSQNYHSDVIITFDETDSIAYAYKEGDYILARTKLQKIRKNTNPYAFDYAFYLKTKGILHQGFIKPNSHKMDKETQENTFTQIARFCSGYASRTFRKYINDPKILGIAEALLLGQTLLISEDVYQAYSDTGAIHVLSVSGLHVAIFISIFIWMFSKSSRDDFLWKIFKIVSLLVIVWFYVVMTGMAPSVMRAGIMVSIYIIGINLFKGTNSYNILAIAAIIMLIYNPYYIFQASFQFSFISLLSILYFQPKIKAWWNPQTKAGIFVWDLVNVSLAAQIMIFPVTVYYFHQFPTYFAISGIVAVPLVTFIIYCGTMLIIFEAVFSSINIIVAPFFTLLIKGLNFSIEWISKLPFSKIENIWISEIGLSFMIISILVMILWLELRHIRLFYTFLSCLLIVVVENRIHHMETSQTNDVVIYDTYGATLIDIFDKNTWRKIELGDLSQKNIDFAAKNNRIQHNVKEGPDYHVTKNNLVSIHGKLMYVLDDNENPNGLRKKTKVDILVITKGKNSYPENILHKIEPEMVVLDRNLPPWIVKKWLNLRNNSGFKIHNIKEDGAFVLSSYKTM
jgi:competence protein ComEC